MMGEIPIPLGDRGTAHPQGSDWASIGSRGMSSGAKLAAQAGDATSKSPGQAQANLRLNRRQLEQAKGLTGLAKMAQDMGPAI